MRTDIYIYIRIHNTCFMYLYVYAYLWMCMCVYPFCSSLSLSLSFLSIYIYIRICIYIYIYISIYTRAYRHFFFAQRAIGMEPIPQTLSETLRVELRAARCTHRAKLYTPQPPNWAQMRYSGPFWASLGVGSIWGCPMAQLRKIPVIT